MAATAKIIKVVVGKEVRSAVTQRPITSSSLRTVESFLNRTAGHIGVAANANRATYLADRTAELVLAAAYAYSQMFEDPLDNLVKRWFRDDWARIELPSIGGPPSFKLPRGVVWAAGPCPVYDGYPALPQGEGAAPDVCTYGFIKNFTQQIPLTNALVNEILARGAYVNMQYQQARQNDPDWEGEYFGQGRLWAPDPNDFEPWDDQIHGNVPDKITIPMFDPTLIPQTLEPLNEILDALGRPRIDEAAQQQPAMWPGMPPSRYGADAWWETPPFAVPVELPRPREGQISVTFPSTRPTQKPGFSVKPVPYPGVGASPQEIEEPLTRPGQRPSRDPRTKPGQKPNVVPDTPRPFQPQMKMQPTVNPLVHVNLGPQEPPGRNTRERKGQVAKGVWFAMQVMGAVSEFADGVKAFYKSLPPSVRKEAREYYGQQPNLVQMLQVLWKHQDEIDLGEALARVLISQIEDLINAKIAQPFDKWLQKQVPDFLQRQAVRQVIRQAINVIDYKPPSVQIEKELEKAGLLDKEANSPKEDITRIWREYNYQGQGWGYNAP